MKPEYYSSGRRWTLPPLILHPFSDASSPQKLVQSSRATLMLQGLLPNKEFSVEQLEETIAEGRICEVRMLFYVGRDLLRWIEQCVEIVEREETLRTMNITGQSFAALLVEDAPAPVKEKLGTWGVQDYKAIFARSIGLNSVFTEAPELHVLARDFVRNYHQYADSLFQCWMASRQFVRVRSAEFDFELYASGEYSRMLERQWEASE
jgi:hypothetical protein